ncbi:hypothetical protein [Microcoleus sp. FACHB-831]|uniref:IS1/IS1595 family N-terminal zinc-binding domain-containing protein n=1 Tax=Microcoleus sp. FACHB-831 TaxID=2692827 RepID=UPI0018EFDFF8|nr:hypothetical protein [Microcoleus sp. FACHB-831]
MTDHLEPYRRMVRSLRFMPPLALKESNQQPVLPPPPINSNQNSWVSTAPEYVHGPTPNHSEHIAALVRDAVSKPTVVPVTYAIAENIGDRISRLAPPKVVNHVIIQPKIPQPDPNWKPAPTVVQEHRVTGWETSAPTAIAAETVQVKAPATDIEDDATEEDLVTEETVVEEPATEVAETPLQDLVGEETVVEEPATEVAETPLQDLVALEKVEEANTNLAKTTDQALVADEAVEEPTTNLAETTDQDLVADEAVEEPTTNLAETTDQDLVADEAVVEEPTINLAETTDQDLVADEAVVEEPTNAAPDTDAKLATVEIEKTPLEAAPSLDQDQSEDNVAATMPTVALVEQTPTEANGTETENAQESAKESQADRRLTAFLPGVLSPQWATKDSTVRLEKVSPLVESTPAPLDNAAAEDRQSAIADATEKNTPAPAVEAAAKEEKIEIKCPKCDSTELRKNGHRNEKQRYVCKDCGRQFAIADPALEAQSSKSMPAKPAHSRGKAKKQAKGFGSSKK